MSRHPRDSFTLATKLNAGFFETLEGREFRRHSGVLVRGHGPFVWESMPEKAVEKAVVLERVDGMACALDAGTAPISQTLLDRHFLRKHGENAYYG